MQQNRFVVRLADNGDDDWILQQVPRFVDFPLPAWRRRNECIEGIGNDLGTHLEDQPANSFLFIAEDRDDGQRAGFVHLKKVQDFFNGRINCHIADLAVAKRSEGQGVGRLLLEHAEQWAREHRCHMVTLAVFPGNERARRIYDQAGYGIDLLRMAKPLKS